MRAKRASGAKSDFSVWLDFDLVLSAKLAQSFKRRIN